MKKLFITVGLILGAFSCFSQVGVGTNSPQATIDVAGTVRVTEIDKIENGDNSMGGVTASNILNKTEVGANLFIEGNELGITPTSRSIADFDLGAVPVDGSGNIAQLDLMIDPGQDNESSTFIRVHSYTSVINIAGIKGGTEGRHLTLYLSEASNIRFLENSALANSEDRFVTLATSQLQASGEAILEFVYDADAGPDGLGRWLVLKFRS